MPFLQAVAYVSLSECLQEQSVRSSHAFRLSTPKLEIAAITSKHDKVVFDHSELAFTY
jgi:hypothetical protein